MSYIPLMINLSGRKVVVVGGGNVAQRRLDALKESGAALHIVSPEINEDLFSLFRQGKINWDKKAFESNDILGASLVVAATDNPEVNRAVRQSAGDNALINMTGTADDGNVIFPGTYRRGRLVFSVSTGGASPMLASEILNDFKSRYDARYERYIDFLYVCRKRLKQSTLSKEEKNRWLSHLLSDKYLKAENQGEILEWLETLE